MQSAGENCLVTPICNNYIELEAEHIELLMGLQGAIMGRIFIFGELLGENVNPYHVRFITKPDEFLWLPDLVFSSNMEDGWQVVRNTRAWVIFCQPSRVLQHYIK